MIVTAISSANVSFVALSLSNFEKPVITAHLSRPAHGFSGDQPGRYRPRSGARRFPRQPFFANVLGEIIDHFFKETPKTPAISEKYMDFQPVLCYNLSDESANGKARASSDER